MVHSLEQGEERCGRCGWHGFWDGCVCPECSAPTFGGQELRLVPRPVPKPLYGITLRASLGDQSPVGWWLNRISRPVRRLAEVCEVCGTDGSDSPEVWGLCCDEVWDYSEGDYLVEQVYDYGLPYEPYDTPTARLSDFQALCWRCNLVIHVGLLLTRYPNLRDEVYAHGAKVNGISVEEFVKVVYASFDRQKAQSFIRWNITWDGWEQLLARKLDRLRREAAMRTF